MRKLLLVGVIIACAFISLSAQIPGYPNGCERCGVFGYVDAPAAPVTTNAPVPVVSGTIRIAGWGFECVSGTPVDRVDVWYSKDDGFFTPVPYWLVSTYFFAARPDVAAAYRSYCPTVSGESGYHAYVADGAIPKGTRVLVVNAWRGPYFSQDRRVLVIR